MKLATLLIIFLGLICFEPLVFGQESLLLGELKLDEISPQKRTDGVKKILIYGMKYKKRGNYKDSSLQAIEDFSENGELLNRTTFGGRKGERSYKKSYTYDEQGNVTSFVNMAQGGMGVEARVANFVYNGKNQLVKQNISLANIVYEYFSDGRLKSKAYYYNNGSESNTEPWFSYFFYDDSLNLVHVGSDSTYSSSTSFYDDKNQLILHDYYPGVAYSKYSYDERGLCIQQVDYEMGKKGWDSTQFFYHYNDARVLDQTSSINRKGKFSLERQRNFDKNGLLISEIFYRKRRPKRFYSYTYSYFKE